MIRRTHKERKTMHIEYTEDSAAFDDSQSGTQFLSNLSSYAFNTETLPSHEEAKKILASEKIDTSKLKIWANDQLRSARALSLIHI